MTVHVQKPVLFWNVAVTGMHSILEQCVDLQLVPCLDIGLASESLLQKCVCFVCVCVMNAMLPFLVSRLQILNIVFPKILLWLYKVKVKKVKFTLEPDVKAQRAERGITLLFSLRRRYVGWVVNATGRPLNRRERDRPSILMMIV